MWGVTLQQLALLLQMQNCCTAAVYAVTCMFAMSVGTLLHQILFHIQPPHLLSSLMVTSAFINGLSWVLRILASLYKLVCWLTPPPLGLAVDAGMLLGRIK